MLCIKRIVLLQRRILDFDNCAFFSRIASVDMALKVDTRIVIVIARYRQYHMHAATIKAFHAKCMYMKLYKMKFSHK